MRVRFTLPTGQAFEALRDLPDGTDIQVAAVGDA